MQGDISISRYFVVPTVTQRRILESCVIMRGVVLDNLVTAGNVDVSLAFASVGKGTLVSGNTELGSEGFREAVAFE